jgi:predicted AAA+ superfamily ATPase
VSLQELLARQLGISKSTSKAIWTYYLKFFVIYKVPGFSRNLRKEITNQQMVFFMIMGFGAIIANFSRLDSRTDVGSLWENYLSSER